MCDLVREQPDGEDDGEEVLDPRVEVELENLNKASNDINILEKELDEARAVFRQRLTDAARNLKHLAKTLGNNIDKARPYFEALNQAKKAQLECQNATMTYERACQLHKGARETIAVAEEKLMCNPGMFDAAWQEMLNNANQKILEAEKEKLKNEALHQEAAMTYRELEQRATQLEKQLKRSINKARPYFEQKAQYLGYLETQKSRVQELESSYGAAKLQYSRSLRTLELISEDIHRKRNSHLGHVCVSTPTSEREECIGAEASGPSRRKSVQRKMSEDRIKKALVRHRSASRTVGRYRSSLLLDLDVDIDFDDSLDYADIPKSPSSKSVDMGCVSMRYYDDYQVLDVAPFLEKERRKSLKHRLSDDVIPEINELHELSNDGEKYLKSRSDTATSFSSNTSSEFGHIIKSRSETAMSADSTESTEFGEMSHTKRSSSVGSEFDIISSHNVDVARLSISGKSSPGPTCKDSRQMLVKRFSMIAEMESSGDEIDALDNIPAHETDDELDHEDGEQNEDKETDDELDHKDGEQNEDKKQRNTAEENSSRYITISCEGHEKFIDESTPQMGHVEEATSQEKRVDETAPLDECVNAATPPEESVYEL